MAGGSGGRLDGETAGAPRIRAGAPADAPALAAMMLDFEAALNALAVEPGETTHCAPAQAAAMAALALRPGGPARVLIAENANGCVGYLTCSPVLWMDDAAVAFFISDLYVAAAARGAGAGRALIGAAAAAARAEGASRLVWCVWRRNTAALAFYRRLGAEEIAQEALLTLPLR